MVESVSLLQPRFVNPATNPMIDEVLRANLAVKRANAVELLHAAVEEFGKVGGEVTFANSFGAEDMVLTDLILKEGLPIEIFSLDTGRLPAETYTLIGEVEQHYGTRLKVFFPESGAVEQYVRTHGINAFYDSVELRKACCAVRKVEPLRRALAGKKAWITGMRAAQSATRTDLPTRQFDEGNGLEKYNPLADWSEKEVWAYIRIHGVPYNALHDQFYPSIGCAPCTRAITIGEDIRAGRWWWENPDSKECGLHKK
ncbi:MAG: phosphoadenosine phosphosulfate reductase [Candidatus Dactylopiibacterium carminicum]|uniref:Adenosine 5'-phosphosulfate reductase n=1 Tax=Candidatus Dactylopiibacterium carminicum TaxID=857335 RepID=A0A272EWW4_9RHOO|nr:phosphoadenylyl-sulfate reductase [Candidatus Dactylopiibacterium carminicum]KAF7600075.1 phosphoadenylyl-sulfate reductase [Candidatus Dactylopiibacterium carminicum]PAS94607.1 MAG: phosphoadenosine phosphosulfate reductase [Candidatus Dactylopiibacterium carminicum]PAS97646.1 MAG: phosphoadenosine phosphosulfate reductase [Candidatus Dactylopiibacterium carminicum]PAT00078.1 MAG: phosphoadenosine phosphosulfate reductase [Candidatus Dactylopiibacterium carminicum]